MVDKSEFKKPMLQTVFYFTVYLPLIAALQVNNKTDPVHT